MKYGRLLLVDDEGLSNSKHRCLCDCGNTVFVVLNHLKSGNTKSCGCLRRELTSKKFRKHFWKGTSEYNSWVLMRDRCNNKLNKNFVSYGGRGICVSEEWNDFLVFISDMGEKPASGYTLDRIDNNGNYNSKNCRWATRKEQSRNRNITKRISFNGESKTIGQWSEDLNIAYHILYKRLWRGWSADRALTTKFNKGCKL